VVFFGSDEEHGAFEVGPKARGGKGEDAEEKPGVTSFRVRATSGHKVARETVKRRGV
jgi:hypothetical protein